MTTTTESKMSGAARCAVARVSNMFIDHLGFDEGSTVDATVIDESVIQDRVTDLMHWLYANGMDVDDVVASAFAAFESERDGGDDFANDSFYDSPGAPVDYRG